MFSSCPAPSSVPTPNVVQPLTTFDNGAQAIGVCVKYVLTGDALDLDKLEAAVRSVTQKWRVLAGRTEWLAEKRIWAIRVPTGPLPPSYATYSFTTDVQPTTPYPSTIASYTPSTASYRPQPTPTYFLHPSTPRGNKAYASHPLISVHVTVFKDATCVGLSFGHGVMDGSGFGEVVKALNAELAGKEWEVPPLPTSSNPLAECLDAVPLPSSTAVTRPSRYFVPSSPLALSKFVASTMVQHFYHGIERGEVYLGKDVVKRIVGEVKKELKERGEGEWVSTADIVNAWVLKAAYLDEPDSPNTLECFHAFNVRPVLANTASSRSLESYPHNAVLLAELPPIPLRSLATLPLSTLALAFRNSLNEHRTLPHVKHHTAFAASSTTNYLPHRAWDVDAWGFSNQVAAGLDKVDWGAGVKTREMVVSAFPFNLISNVYLNSLDGGYVITGDVRKSRWRAIESELKRLREGGERLVV